MVEKLEERDMCKDGVDGLSFGGVLVLFERALELFGGAPGSLGGVLGLLEVLESFGADTESPASLSSLLFPRSELYLAMSTRISSGDKTYGVMSSAVSKASLSPSTGRKGGLEVVIIELIIVEA